MEQKRFLSRRGLLACALLACAAGVLCLAGYFAPRGTTAVLERSGQVLWQRDLAALTEPETIPVEGENGITLTVELSSQGAAVISSTCPDQVCVHTGQLTRTGESAICLPAQVVLRLEGGAPAVDATVY